MSPEEAEMAEAEELLRAAEEKGGRPWPRGVYRSMAGAAFTRAWKFGGVYHQDLGFPHIIKESCIL